MRRNDSSQTRSFFAGVLAVNSIGHLATAVAGKEHLTPLAGRRSGPTVNAIWGAANLAGGLALAHAAATPGRRWGADLHAFATGAAIFAGWMAVSERLLGTNTDPAADHNE